MLKLSSEVLGHDHIIYIRAAVEPESVTENGDGIIGFTSANEDDGHQHEIWYNPGSMGQEIPNPDTGEPMVIPERYFVQEVNGHTHEILDQYLSIPSNKREKNPEDYEEIKKKYLQIAAQAYDNDCSQYHGDAIKAEEMVFGGEYQWDESIKQVLQKMKRPYLSFNVLKNKVNTLVGFFRSDPMVPKVKPTEGSDATLSDVYNALITHTLADCDYKSVQSEVVTDMIITGRGNINIGIDTKHGVEYGDPMIDHQDWEQVNYMPHRKKDLSDCEGVVKWRWVTKDYLLRIAPESKKKDIEQMSGSNIPHDTALYYTAQNEPMLLFDNNVVNEEKYRLMNVTRREYKERLVIFNPVDEYYLDGEDGAIESWLLDAKTRKRILSIPGFTKDTRRVTEYWVGTFAADIMLYDRLSEFDGYMTIPCYATIRRGRIKGEVYDLIDPQNELNKRTTSYIELLMRLGTNAEIYDDETFNDENDKQNYETGRSTPGALLKVANADKPPREKTPPRFPTELLQIAQLSEKHIDLISGFNTEGVAGVRGVQSTPLFRERRNAALANIQYLFDNYNIMLRQLGFRLIEMYRILYTPERIYRILENHSNEMRMKNNDEFTINGISFTQYNAEAIKKIWENPDSLKYDIVIDYGPYYTTKSDENFATFAQLAQQGVPGITADFLLQLRPDIDEAQKKRLLNAAQQGQQMQAQLEQQKNNIEIEKTNIAQQGQNIRQQQQFEHETRMKVIDKGLNQS
jgi:hypothetical protein